MGDGGGVTEVVGVGDGVGEGGGTQGVCVQDGVGDGMGVREGQNVGNGESLEEGMQLVVREGFGCIRCSEEMEQFIFLRVKPALQIYTTYGQELLFTVLNNCVDFFSFLSFSQM